jgi:hypothetical protein
MKPGGAMKTATLAFLFVLWLALQGNGPPDPYYQPLSMLRDGPRWPWGYGLFGLLELIGALMALAMWRAGRSFEAGYFAVGVLLLAVITVTPSDDGFHFFCSLVLLFLLYTYYAVRLHLAETGWRYAHWVMPLVLALLTACQSYGLWQKAFIVYFVLAITAHHHLLGRPLPRPAAPRGWGPAPPLRKRVVYVLEDGEAWVRRR